MTKKTGLFLITLITLCLQSIAISAAELNIIQENNKAEVYIDGQSVGFGSIYKLDIKPGDHHIQVNLNNQKIYSKIVAVYEDQTNTIDTTRFVEAGKSKITNIGAQQIETQRIKDAKGTLGVGGQFSSIVSGISIKKYFTDKFGVQTLFWANQKKPSYRSFYGRVLYNIADKTFITDKLVSLYAGAGYGSSRKEIEKPDVSDKNYVEKESRNISEYFIGAEMPFKSFAFLNIEVSFVNVDASRTYFESAPDDISKESGNSHDIRIGIGLHAYF